MSAEQYNRMAERMRQRPMALRMLLACNQGMTWLVMIAYPLLLLYCLLYTSVGLTLFAKDCIGHMETYSFYSYGGTFISRQF